MGSFRDLKVYQKSFSTSMEIFNLSKKFPGEEKYVLLTQIRRSSRAIASNIGEAYRKRQYPAYFVSKISDADMEATETQIWMDYALECEYINKQEYTQIIEKLSEIGRMLYHMMSYPEKYCVKPKVKDESYLSTDQM
jgi:four helix bundle protein